MTAPANKEQEICKDCGFCCDGTLFNRATSNAEEKTLPEMTQFLDSDDLTWIELPCPYFDDYCTVYDQTRPQICGDFKCYLLKQSIKGKLSYDQLAELILKIKNQKLRIAELIPNHQKDTLIKDSFHKFMEENQTLLDQPAFRLKHSKLLMEWASYQSRLSKFSKTKVEQKKDYI